MNTVSLAWRNLLRNRRRSLMTLVAMVLGLVAVLLFGGYVRDINYSLQSEFVRRTGHLQIQHKDYFRLGSGNPIAFGIGNYAFVLDTIRQDRVLAPLLAVVTPTLQFGGIAGNFGAGVSRTVFVHGSVVEDQTRMRDWNEYGQRILSSPLSLAGTAPDAALVGIGVAQVLQLCAALDLPDCASVTLDAAPQGAALPDDIAALSGPARATASANPAGAKPRIEILATNARGAPNVAAVTVVRAEFQGIKDLDDVYLGLHLAQAQRLVFGASPPQVSAIAIQLRHTADLPLARARLDELLGTTLKGEPVAVLDFETLNPYYGQALRMFASIFGFIAVLIGAIVLFTVTNTMSMAVVERTVEIGTLRAIGLRRGGIRALFVIEGLVLGCFGAVLGIAAALGLAWVINHLGLTWVAPGRVEPSPLAVRVAGENSMMLVSAIGLVVVSALSAIVPASRASRMNIVEALRHV
jgi:putative ABC transport system permease protein